MPIYGYKCAVGHSFERVLRVADYDEPQTCECGAVGERQIYAPMVIGDIAEYQSPIDGKIISSRKQRREDLRKHNCVEYEPSLVNEQEKRHAREDAVLDRKVDEIVEKEIYEMPAHKRERLVNELESGADIGYARI